MSVLGAEARLAPVAARQGGAFTRDQAVRAGFSPSQVQRRLDAGAWVRIYPRVYRHGGSPPSRALVLTAAIIWAGPDAVLSHTTAAAMWRVTAETPDRVELLVPRTRSPRAPGTLIHRAARLDRIDVTTRGGLPVTTPVRTLIDLAAVIPGAELAVILDRSLRRGLVTRRTLERRLETLGTRGRPGTAGLRALLGTFGSGSEHASARMAG
jgi:putative AbiEi antitoxin of type IV toxin-antitoxin system/transcriptional regulator with AbiEi antitoxin domain of type IV toxin-antitoxin system